MPKSYIRVLLTGKALARIFGGICVWNPNSYCSSLFVCTANPEFKWISFGTRLNSTPGTATPPRPLPPRLPACLITGLHDFGRLPNTLLSSELASLCVFQMTEAQRCQKKDVVMAGGKKKIEG